MPPSFDTLLQVFHRRWRMMLGLGLVSAALAVVAVCYGMPARYTAQLLLQISARPWPGSSDAEADPASIQRTYAALIKSPAILQAVLAKPEVHALPEVQTRPDPLGWLEKDLVTDDLLGPAILRVKLSGDRPDDAAAVLNAVGQTYLEELTRREDTRARARLRQLQENYRSCAADLRNERQKLQARERELGLADRRVFEARSTVALQQMAAAQHQRVQVLLDLRKAETDLAALQAKRGAVHVLVPESAIEAELKQDPAAQKVREQLAGIEADLAWSRTHIQPAYLENSRSFQSRERERKAVEQILNGMRAEIRERLEEDWRIKKEEEQREGLARAEAQIQVIKDQQRAVDTDIRQLEGVIENLRLKQHVPDQPAAEVAPQHDDIAYKEQTVKRIAEELGALQANLPVPPRVQILEPAAVPQAKEAGRQRRYAGTAGAGMFGLVVLGVTLLELRARRVYLAEDVVRGLGLSVIGTVPAIPAAAHRSLSGPSSSRYVPALAALTESVDGIRNVLLHSARSRPLRIVLVTSALGGEGKTLLASHLARSLCRAGRRTLLVDCDLRKPDAHRQLGLPAAPGFCEALRGEIEPPATIQATAVDGLGLLPAGRWDSGASKALAQDRARVLFEHLKAAYDLLVVDSSPILPVADSLLLGQYADGALFAVLRNVSRLPAVHAAYRRLGERDVPILGAVVIGASEMPYGVSYNYAATTKL